MSSKKQGLLKRAGGGLAAFALMVIISALWGPFVETDLGEFVNFIGLFVGLLAYAIVRYTVSSRWPEGRGAWFVYSLVFLAGAAICFWLVGAIDYLPDRTEFLVSIVVLGLLMVIGWAEETWHMRRKDREAVGTRVGHEETGRGEFSQRT